MSATLQIVNNFSIETQGRTYTGKQGAIADGFDESFDFTVSGKVQGRTDLLATASIATLWDEDAESPSGFDYFHFVGDQDCYLQLIAQATNVIVKVEAFMPFTLSGFDDILAAANTTPIAGGTEPTMSKIDSIILGNYSGNDLNYQYAVID